MKEKHNEQRANVCIYDVLTYHFTTFKYLSQIQSINGCLKSLSSSQVMASSTSQSASNNSLAESSSNMGLSDTGEVTMEESLSDGRDEAAESVKLKELLEESQLVSAQFSINKVSLEIHSRGEDISL